LVIYNRIYLVWYYCIKIPIDNILGVSGGLYMVLLVRRPQMICSLVMVVVLLLSGCSGTNPQLTMVSASAVAGADSNAVMVDYLQAAKEDFTSIDELIQDKDLGLLDEDTTGDEAVTVETLQKYLGILSNYDTKISTRLDAIRQRETPNHPDIAAFKASELSEFEMAANVIEEYIQVLKYMKSLINMGAEMDKLGNVDTTDLEGTYKAISTGITQAIGELRNDDVPTFLLSMNDNMVTGLGEMNDAVLYTLNAAALTDPVRTDSAEYRLGILTRKFTKLSTDAQQDMNDRQTKLKSDVKGIKQTNDGLKNWVQLNIDKLS
jgi:hypothetical protein